jgi:hypothetical protein
MEYSPPAHYEILNNTVKIIEQSYLADDGLMKLEKDETHPGFGMGPTVLNHNGLLFLVYAYYLRGEHITIKERKQFESILTKLRSGIGIYDRRPGDKTLPNSVDNLIAIAAGASLFGFDTATEINARVKRSKLRWDTQQPQDPRIRFSLQPHVIYMLEVVSNAQFVDPTGAIWLLGSAAFTWLLPMKKHWSEYAMLWLMTSAMYKCKPSWFRTWIYKTHLKQIERQGGFKAMFEPMEPADHPIHALAEIYTPK